MPRRDFYHTVYMKDYYQILGVSRTASFDTIRSAYRKLVVLYHPDKNPAPDAHERIAEINHAYDVLSDDEKRRSYDLKLTYGWTEHVQEPPARTHRDPRYRPGAARPSTGSRRSTQYELMKEYLPFVKWFSYAGLAVTLLLAADRILPFETAVEQIHQIYAVRGKYNDVIYYLLETNTGREVVMYREEALYFSEQTDVMVHFTSLYSIPMKLTSDDGSRSLKLGYIYRTMVFMPVVLFLVSLGGMIWRNRVEFAFNLNIVTAVLLVINLYLIFQG